MTDTPATLANWRQSPFNTWSFGHVDKLIPVAKIPAGTTSPLPLDTALDTAAITAQFENRSWSFADILAETETDGLLVLRQGRIVHESYRNGDVNTRHILFSVSKSIALTPSSSSFFEILNCGTPSNTARNVFSSNCFNASEVAFPNKIFEASTAAL